VSEGDDLAACRDDLPHGRGEQAPLGDHGLGLQDLGERMAGPATTGKFCIEQVEAAGKDRRDRRAELVAAPNGGSDVSWQGIARLDDASSAPDAVLRGRKGGRDRLLVVAGPPQDGGHATLPSYCMNVQYYIKAGSTANGE
jgi:hypothetical protein